MVQTEGRYPVIYSEQAAGTLWGIWEMRDYIDFLKDFDPLTDVGTVDREMNVNSKQYQLILGRAAKTVYATLLNGTKEEIVRAIKFAFIAIECEKHSLDILQARWKYGFDELEEKYVRGEKA